MPKTVLRHAGNHSTGLDQLWCVGPSVTWTDDIAGTRSVGRFAQLSGLSIHALRHYDDVGLLEPAVVDADTGYRRYRRGQIPRARLNARILMF